MALTTETTFSDKRVGGLFSTFEEKVPVGANAVLYGGAIVGMLGGYAVALAAFPQAQILGKAVGDVAGQGTGPTNPTVDNTGGSAGAKFVRVERGVFLMKNSAGVSALAAADTGEACYFVDDETVSKHSNNGNRPSCGTFLGLDSGTSGCWVQIGQGPQERVIATGLAGADLSSHQYGAVKLSSGAFVKAGAGDLVFGILQNAPANGAVARVCVAGPTLAKAGAGFTQDASVASDSNGLLVDATQATLNAHAAQTQDTLTDNSAGTANTTIEAMPSPADTPATADALRDDLVANFIPAVRNNFADVAAQLAKIKADVAAIIGNTSIVGSQVCGQARETAAGSATKIIHFENRGLI